MLLWNHSISIYQKFYLGVFELSISISHTDIDMNKKVNQKATKHNVKMLATFIARSLGMTLTKESKEWFQYTKIIITLLIASNWKKWNTLSTVQSINYGLYNRIP